MESTHTTLARAFSRELHNEHMGTCGPSQYSHYRFLLWVFQEYPSEAVRVVTNVVNESLRR
jgi:hypothetical protein